MQKIEFDYFRGMEADQYSFYRVPKVLFTAECFKELSCEAKVLYGLMLDRMSLSIKNRWLDGEDRVYIIFTVEEIMELLGCARQKAIKSIAELDGEKGIGLIEKRRLGLGRPNVIYVKNFMLKEVGETEEVCPENDENTQKYENQTSRSMENEFQEVPKLNVQEYGNQTSESIAQEFAEIPEANFKKYENQTSASMKSELQEVPKSNFKKCENQTSGGMKIKFPEVRKSNGNNTDINETEYSETEFNDTDNSDTADSLSNPSYPAKNEAGRMMDVMEQINVCRELIRKNIAYETFGNGGHREREEVDELVELMTEVMMLPDEAVVRISGTEKPAGIVKSQFMKIGQAHIQYVMGCLGSNTTKVGNIKSYLLTALYNSVMTMEHYYRAEVNHNMYGGACR